MAITKDNEEIYEPEIPLRWIPSGSAAEDFINEKDLLEKRDEKIFFCGSEVQSKHAVNSKFMTPYLSVVLDIQAEYEAKGIPPRLLVLLIEENGDLHVKMGE